MSVWLTPEGRPFYGGTYFPPDNRYGRAGFPSILTQIARLWQQDRERIEAEASRVIAALAEAGKGAVGEKFRQDDTPLVDGGQADASIPQEAEPDCDHRDCRRAQQADLEPREPKRACRHQDKEKQEERAANPSSWHAYQHSPEIVHVIPPRLSSRSR